MTSPRADRLPPNLKVHKGAVVCSPTARLTVEDLTKVFNKAGGRGERIGIEVEIAAVDQETGVSRPYEGEGGIRALLETVLSHSGGHPILEGDNLVGIQRDDGTQITLEPGGAVEYASAPTRDLVRLMEKHARTWNFWQTAPQPSGSPSFPEPVTPSTT